MLNNLKKILSKLNLGVLIVGTVLGLYTLIDIMILKLRPTKGICPLNRNRLLIYIAISLLILSFVLSFFEPKKDKNKTL